MQQPSTFDLKIHAFWFQCLKYKSLTLYLFIYLFILFFIVDYLIVNNKKPFKRHSHKMVKHTKTIRRQGLILI